MTRDPEAREAFARMDMQSGPRRQLRPRAPRGVGAAVSITASGMRSI